MSEPVEYQMRMRPTWEITSWSDWKKCSRDSFDDYTKTPKLHDWEYEVRELYATPPQRTWAGLTDEEVDQFYNWKDCTWSTNDLVRYVEAKLKEKNT